MKFRIKTRKLDKNNKIKINSKCTISNQEKIKFMGMVLGLRIPLVVKYERLLIKAIELVKFFLIIG